MIQPHSLLQGLPLLWLGTLTEIFRIKFPREDRDFVWLTHRFNSSSVLPQGLVTSGEESAVVVWMTGWRKKLSLIPFIVTIVFPFQSLLLPHQCLSMSRVKVLNSMSMAISPITWDWAPCYRVLYSDHLWFSVSTPVRRYTYLLLNLYFSNCTPA